MTTEKADSAWTDELVAHIDAGKPVWLASKLLGLHPSQLYRAAQRDPELAAKLRAADARRQEKLLTAIEHDAESYPAEWKKKAWLLEKTSPELREPRDVPQQVQAEVLRLLDELEPLMSSEAHGELISALDKLARGPVVVEAQAALPRPAGDDT